MSNPAVDLFNGAGGFCTSGCVTAGTFNNTASIISRKTIIVCFEDRDIRVKDKDEVELDTESRVVLIPTEDRTTRVNK